MTRFLPILSLLAACSDGGDLTETGNPNLKAQLAMRARSSAPDVVAIDGTEAPVTVVTAVLAIDRLRLVMGEECDVPGETEWDVPVPATVDLATGLDAVPFDARSGGYCRVRLRLDDHDASVTVTGTREDGVPYAVRSNSVDEIDIRSRTAPFVLDEARDALILAFDVARWLDPALLATAQTGPDGTVRVEEGRNDAVLEAFEEGLEASIALFEDLDEDGDLSDGEDEDALATSE